MNKLLELIVYVYNKYPKVEELSKTRLVKLIYLIDWKYTLLTGKQFTDIKWYFNHYGPYVEDVMNLVKQEKSIFNVDSYENRYGGHSDRITKIKPMNVELSEAIMNASDFIISNTKNLNWPDFISLVYSTFPVQNNSKYTYLNLESEAVEFKQKKNLHINQ
jgi:hypothetical protein